MQLIQPIRTFFVVKTEFGVTAAMGVVYDHCTHLARRREEVRKGEAPLSDHRLAKNDDDS
jgi:hypothetical protein